MRVSSVNTFAMFSTMFSKSRSSCSKQIVLNGDARDQAVKCGTNRDPGLTASEVNERGLPVAFYWVPRMVEGLGAQVLRHLVELSFRTCFRTASLATGMEPANSSQRIGRRS